MDSIKYLDSIGMGSLFSVAKGRDRLVLLCLYDLGCRVGELVTTRVSDIDFHNGFIRIQSSRTKTRHFRAPGEPNHSPGHQGEPAVWPGVAPSRPELRSSVHQDGSQDRRPPGRRGRDPGNLAQAEALPEEGHAPYSQAQSCGECADGWRAGAHDSEAGGAQEAVYDGDLCHRGASVGERGV